MHADDQNLVIVKENSSPAVLRGIAKLHCAQLNCRSGCSRARLGMGERLDGEERVERVRSKSEDYFLVFAADGTGVKDAGHLHQPSRRLSAVK